MKWALLCWNLLWKFKRLKDSEDLSSKESESQLIFLGMKNERIYGISVVDSNNTDYPKLCSPDNASNYSEKYQNGPYCGMHEVKNG